MKAVNPNPGWDLSNRFNSAPFLRQIGIKGDPRTSRKQKLNLRVTPTRIPEKHSTPYGGDKSEGPAASNPRWQGSAGTLAVENKFLYSPNVSQQKSLAQSARSRLHLWKHVKRIKRTPLLKTCDAVRGGCKITLVFCVFLTCLGICNSCVKHQV